MALSKIQAESMNLADTFAFTGTVSGVGGGENVPAFLATVSIADQSITASTWTKVAFNEELVDSDGCYDHSSNYRFTPTEAGKYFIFVNLYSGNPNTHIYTGIYRNGSPHSVLAIPGSQSGGSYVGNIVTFNGSSDYVEAYTYQGTGTGQVEGATQYSVFGGYKLIGV